jgi:dihydrofolate reductase
MTEYRLIIAASTEGAIGLNNQLLWRLPSDLKRFKELTTNQVVVMGRQTYESIGKPLPNRENIILSSQPRESILGYQPEAKVFSSVKATNDYLDQAAKGKQIWIIGGNQIYKQFLPFVSEIHYSNVIVGKPLQKAVDFDTEFYSIHHLIDSGEWEVKPEPTRAVYDSKSFLLSDQNKKPLTYIPYILTRKK